MSSPTPGPGVPFLRLRSRTYLLLLVLLSVPFIACGGGEVSEAEPDIYSARGIVRQLPAESRPGGELFIHHEAIPEFRDEDGEVVGMDSMAMPFPLASDTELGELAAGDRIRFSFEVRWQANGNPLQLTFWEPLGDDVLLDFEQPLEAAEGSRGEEGSEGEVSTEEEASGGPPASP